MEERNVYQEIKYYFHLAIPMSLSLATHQIMNFVDRMFLGRYGGSDAEIYLSAGLIGGMTAYTLMAFFDSMIGYSSTIVAQHYGANKKHACGKIIAQAVRLSMYIYPIFIVAALYIPIFYRMLEHNSLQELLESQYTRILLFGAIIQVLSSGVGGFFIGIGNTRVVLFASVLAMIVNIPFNYVLIFGKWVFPEMGMRGAALGTLLSNAVKLLCLCAYYLHSKYHKEFYTRTMYKLDKTIIKKFFVYGAPGGIEVLVGMIVFSTFLIAMNTYGTGVGAATAIALSWDGISFITVLGGSFATSAIVGQYIGARQVQRVYRVYVIAMGFALFYVAIISYFFFFQQELLIGVFLDDTHRFENIYGTTKTMLKIASVYVFFDAILLNTSAVLKGAGDTKVLMVLDILCSLIFGLAVVLFIFPHRVSPMGAWIILAFVPVLNLVLIGSRLLSGKWKEKRIVDD